MRPAKNTSTKKQLITLIHHCSFSSFAHKNFNNHTLHSVQMFICSLLSRSPSPSKRVSLAFRKWLAVNT